MKIKKISIIFLCLYLIANITSYTLRLLYTPTFDKQISEMKSDSKEKIFTHKNQLGTWTVYLKYDDPEQKYSKYDNLIRGQAEIAIKITPLRMQKLGC